MHTPKVAAIHDMSGFGRCSLTVAIPVLSAMGVQCCPLPTAFLSTHTGGFEGYTFLDMTAEMEKVMKHWESLGLTFDAIYSGFLGSEAQVEIVERFIRTFRGEAARVVVDPVMGDDGQRYRTYTAGMCSAMERLAASADVITPNMTEASFLLGIPYVAMPREEKGYRACVEQLSLEGCRSVVLTGVSTAPELIGAVCFDAQKGQLNLVQTSRVGGDYHGTGDIFSSVLTGALVNGESLHAATEKAVIFVEECAARSREAGIPKREGVDFEPLLGKLMK